MLKIKIILSILGIFFLLSGCDKSPRMDDYRNKEIDKIIVSYDKDSYIVDVEINMGTEKRMITHYSDTREEVVDEYKYADELNEFVKTKVLSHYDKTKKNEVINSYDEQKRKWSIKILFKDEESIFISSFTEYPEFWSDFVRLLEK